MFTARIILSVIAASGGIVVTLCGLLDVPNKFPEERKSLSVVTGIALICCGVEMILGLI